MGWVYMEPMDQACFVSTSKSHVNFMSVTGFGEGVMSKEDTITMYKDTIRRYPKFTNIIETKGADLYYSKISEEDAFNKGFKFLEGEDAITNQHDIDLFIQDNINVKMPLDGP